jgi:TolB protein
MQKAFFLFAALLAAAPACGQLDAGVVDVQADPNKSTAITVSASTTELQNLALTAFNAHSGFRLVASGGAYTVRFEPVGTSQVAVTVARGSGTPVLQQTVAGSSARNALFRAADVAVARITGKPGWFAGRIVFVSSRGTQNLLVTGDLFFGELQSHPVGNQDILGPRWSPDGTRVIFTSYRTGFPDIYVLDLRDRQLSHFASFKGTNSGGRFSPDGTRVAMVLSGEGNPEIYVGTAEGKQIRRLTRNNAVEASQAWSPDGTRLVFTSDLSGGPQLYVMPASGGTMTRLATNISRYCAEPDWSAADPQKIVFTASVGRGYQVAVFDLGTGQSRFVSKAPTDAVEPVWLADGRHVLCTFRGANTRRLHIVDTETGRAVPLSPTSFGPAGNAAYLPPAR